MIDKFTTKKVVNSNNINNDLQLQINFTGEELSIRDSNNNNQCVKFYNHNFPENYDIIKFRNGYAKDASTMLVEYKGYDIGFNGVCEEQYIIKLGKVKEVNYGKRINR